MAKRFSTVLVLLLVLCGIGWVYLAEKFATIATEEILPRFKKDNSLILIDESSITLDKYKFQIHIQKAKIFPHSKHFVMTPDELILYYNPLSDSIHASVKSNKLFIGSEESTVYIPTPNTSIKFNRLSLRDGVKQFNVTVQSQKISVYHTKNDEFLGESNGSELTISNVPDGEIYNTEVDLKIDGLHINPKTQVFAEIVHGVSSELSKIFSYDTPSPAGNAAKLAYLKILNVTGPTDYQCKYSISLSKKHMHDIIAVLHGTHDVESLLGSFTVADIYSFKAHEKADNKVIQDSDEILISSNGKQINTKLSLSMNHKYNDPQKQEVTDLLKTLLFKAFNTTYHDEIAKLTQSINVDDFKNAAGMIADIETVKTGFDIQYDIESNNVSHDIYLDINGTNIQSTGTVNKNLYHGTVEVSDAESLVKAIPNIYQMALRPVLLKLSADKQNNIKIDIHDQIYQNIKENGLDALSAFNKSGANLVDNKKLTTEIKFNPSGFKFDVNGRGILEMLADRRIVRFLKDMPHEEIDNPEGSKKTAVDKNGE